MADVVKRLNYFDHQFLRAQDFNDEQKYHLSMRRRHNSLLHTWGIAQGLNVTLTGGGTGTAVTVSAGVALDSLGQEIVLPADVSLELGGQPKESIIYITITYSEVQSDPTTEAGGAGNTRWSEQPKPTFSTTAPADSSTTLILGKVLRAAGGLGAIDLSDRRAAGVVVSPDLTVSSLTLKKDNVAQNLWPKLSCSGPNQAALTNGSLNLEASREVFFADGGQIRSKNDTRKVVFNTTALEFYEPNDVRFLTGAGLSEKMRVQAGGNVGIGTAAPNRNLTISTTGASTGVYANVKNDNHEVLVGVDQAAIVSAMTASDLQLRTNNNARVVVQANSGNVGIGVAAPKEKLQVDAGSVYLNGENQGVIVDAQGVARTGLMKYPGRETMLVGDSKLSTPVRLGRFTDGTIKEPKTLADDLVINSAGNVAISKNLTVEGQISSPRWRVSQPINCVAGNNSQPVKANFATGGGVLLVFVSGSGFISVVKQIGMDIFIDNVSRGFAKCFTNEANSHKPFSANFLVISGIAAGNHTVSLNPWNGTVWDFNDFFSFTVLELPI